MNKWVYSIGVVLFLSSSIVFGSCHNKEKEMKYNNPHNIKGVISYKRCFNDMNDTQLVAAQNFGVRPVESRVEAEKLGNKLVEIKSCKSYLLDTLTHSIPFLVPRASELLSVIGDNFQDSLINKGLNQNQIIVTSVLRTQSDQKKLRRRNGNATENSAHSYGTTFDISYRRFNKLEDPEGYPTEAVSPDTLKMVLAEVLYDLKKTDKCYVKYELKQGCFHITTR